MTMHPARLRFATKSPTSLPDARRPLPPHAARSPIQRAPIEEAPSKRVRGKSSARPTAPAPTSASPLLVQRSRVSKKRKTTGKSYGQGSHTTAVATYIDMINLRLHNASYAQAAKNLEACFNELREFLPGCRRGSQYLPWATEVARIAIAGAIANPTASTVKNAAEALKKMRFVVPLSTTSFGSRIVHDEQNHAYLLQMEQMLMRGADVTTHRYYANRYEILWQMFDYQPRDGISEQDVLDTIDQHLMSMQATYQILYANHTDERTALEYFLTHCWDTFTEHMSDERAHELHDLLTVMARSYHDV